MFPPGAQWIEDWAKPSIQLDDAYVAPILLGTDGAPGFEFGGPSTLADASRWTLVDVARVGADVRLELEPREGTR